MSAGLISDEVAEETRPCPCCGERPAIPGLYARVKTSPYPVVLGLLMDQPEHYVVNKINDDVWRILGRWFIQAFAGMPLGRRESPIRIATWVEIDELTAMRVLEAMAGHGEAVEAECRLACDLPGFPGTIGAKATFQNFQGDLPELISCEDQRMNAIPLDLGHDQMAALYRRVWGNFAPVQDADLGLRAAVNRHWHDHLGRPFYRRAVTPPPGLAGIRPPELLVCPPLDTGEPVRMATVGCSEHSDTFGRLIELVAEIRNPSEEMIDNFSMFTWFSRSGNGPFGANCAVVPSGGLPGESNDMVAWFLKEPSCLPEPAWAINHGASQVDVLEAVPIDMYEVAFLQVEGAAPLASMLELVDTSDLNRSSVSPLAD